MTKFLQANVNRSRATHDLFQEYAGRSRAHILVASEPNKKLIEKGKWLYDERKDAAIKIIDRKITINKEGRGKGYVWIDTEKFILYTCYYSPNKNIEEYKESLEELANSIKSQKKRDIIVAGDFNSKSPEWGSNKLDKRGEILSEWGVEMRLIPINRGNEPTFVRGNAKSHINITFASENIAVKIQDWTVQTEEETLNGHKFITYKWEKTKEQNEKKCQIKWKLTARNKDKFVENVAEQDLIKNIQTAEEFTRMIIKAAEKTMKRKQGEKRKEEYWWNVEIANLRNECNKDRRAVTRVRKKARSTEGEQEEIQEAETRYKEAKKKLTKEIAKAKKAKWKKLIDEVEEDIWGEGYKIVVRRTRIGPPNPALTIEKQKEVADHLFPKHEEVNREDIVIEETEITKFTRSELVEAVKKLKKKKAPGMDGITTEIMEIMVKEFPDTTLRVMNNCLMRGKFPKEWKEARLVLLRKGHAPIGEPTSYRPLCMLSTCGKLLEQLIKARLHKELEERNDLHQMQYGFRKGLSTITAMEKVIQIANGAKAGCYRSRKICVLITLDVANAFNSASWKEIIGEVKKRKVMPEIARLVNSYLEDREIVIEEGEERQNIKVNSGVPQGSVLGPTLWNLQYDGVLRLKHEEGVHLVGFADDLALMIVDKNEDEVNRKGEKALRKIDKWLKEKLLKLAPQKTEAVVLVSRRKRPNIHINIRGSEIEIKSTVKYLGVWFEHGPTFKTHIRKTAEKVAKTTVALAKLMPNVAGPSSGKRRVLATVAHSAMLYAAPIWQETLQMEKYRRMLLKEQRKLAIRIVSAYRTTSTEAVLVLAGIIPIHIMAMERRECYKGNNTAQEKRTHREEAERKWQGEWEQAVKGEWTRKLIRNVSSWKNRKHGDLTYWTTQVFTGHGSFQSYLKKIGKEETDCCKYCQQGTDDAEHTVFRCPRWERKRMGVEEKIGERITPENMVEVMCRKQENWTEITKVITEIMKIKEGRA